MGLFEKNILLFWGVVLCAVLASCEYSSDGPLKPSNEDFSYEGEGYFLEASLDSGKVIHLTSDTLAVSLKKIWSFSNCALRSVKLGYSKQDSVLMFRPHIRYEATEEDCPSPFYRPDTTMKIFLDKDFTDGIGEVQVVNNKDSVMASVKLRRGKFQRDTFFVYMDSSFANARNLPLRTKTSKSKPSIFRSLDSLTPRKFYWRTMESECTLRVDMCDDVVADTIYPSSWKINDTVLVPVHRVCADSDMVYCVSGKWKNDSTALGKVQERPDTIWHYSTYYAENIPQCGSVNSFEMAGYDVGQKVRFIRELFVPSEDETYCGPSSKKDWMIFDLLSQKMVLDSDSLKVVGDLYKAWMDADVAPDSLIIKD